jgi:hypothetical protein
MLVPLRDGYKPEHVAPALARAEDRDLHARRPSLPNHPDAWSRATAFPAVSGGSAGAPRAPAQDEEEEARMPGVLPFDEGKSGAAGDRALADDCSSSGGTAFGARGETLPMTRTQERAGRRSDVRQTFCRPPPTSPPSRLTGKAYG